jgi:uncharacterized protein (TIGR02145 family)
MTQLTNLRNGLTHKSPMNEKIVILFVTLLFSLGKVAAQSITLEKTNIEMIQYEEYLLFVNTIPAGQPVNWSSNNTNIATVESGRGFARIIAINPGMVKISASFSGQTASCNVTIYDVFSRAEVTINGVTWATRNVGKPGKFVEDATDAGMFYQWNRKNGWSITDPLVNSNGGTEWDNSTPTGTTWETVNDPCPAGWRIPTYEEIAKLPAEYGKYKRIKFANGINGFLFGNYPNVLVLPAAGYRTDVRFLKGNTRGGYSVPNEYCGYWSNTPYYEESAYGFRYGEEDNMFRVNSINKRAFGFCVRCVKK